MELAVKQVEWGGTEWRGCEMEWNSRNWGSCVEKD